MALAYWPPAQSAGFAARAVDVDALPDTAPIKLAVMSPALKFPLPSLKTMVEFVLEAVAVVEALVTLAQVRLPLASIVVA
jgi:hypothetical protein